MNRFLIELRKNSHLSQQAMAEKLGVSQSYYSMLEQGRRRISRRVLIALQENFTIPYEVFLKILYS